MARITSPERAASTVAAPQPRRRPAAAAKAKAPAVAEPAPKLRKDELRAQLAKLERVNATLRAKSRATNKAAKISTARIAELEERLADMEARAASRLATGRRDPKPAAAGPVRGKRASRDVDPGDAVPPGVAVQEPAALDDADKTAGTNETALSHA